MLLVIVLIAWFVSKYDLNKENVKTFPNIKAKKETSEVGVAFKKANNELKTLGNKKITKAKEMNTELSKKEMKSIIIVGQFKTDYFLEENSKKLSDNGIVFLVKELKNSKQIVIPLAPGLDPKFELLRLKSTKIIPKDAYVKKQKNN